MEANDDHDEALLEAERHLFLEHYRPISLSDVTSGRLQPPPWLFGPDGNGDGLLRSETITMLSAEPFTGKTLLMLAMTLGLASRAPICGYRPAAGHRVLFLGQDAPTWDYYGLLRKLWLGLGAPSIPEDRAIFFFNRGLRLDGPDITKLLEDAVRIQGTTVLMIDTLLAFHGRDENSNKEMASVMDLLKGWRDVLGLTILFSHHVSKPSGAKISRNYRARGASVIAGSVDFHLQLTPFGGGVRLGIPKRRGGMKRKATDSFTISDLSSESLALLPRGETPSALELSVGFLSEPHSPQELRAFLGLHFDSSPAALDGRLNGVLGYLRRKELATFLPDGRMVAVRPSSP